MLLPHRRSFICRYPVLKVKRSCDEWKGALSSLLHTLLSNSPGVDNHTANAVMISSLVAKCNPPWSFVNWSVLQPQPRFTQLVLTCVIRGKGRHVRLGGVVQSLVVVAHMTLV